MELYNLKDKDYKNYIRGLSLANKPIKFYNQTINHMTIDYVLSIGEAMYKKIMLPFMLSKDFIYGDNQPNVDMLDILTDSSFEQYHDDLIFGVCLVLNVDVSNVEIITMDNIHKEILIKNEDFIKNLYIDSNKFEQLKSIVLFINNIRELRRADSNSARLNSTEEYNKRLEVFYKGKEEYQKLKSEDSNSDILNMFDFLVHVQENIDYQKVLDMNLYQFYNSIKRYSQKEDFTFTRDLYSSGQVPLKGVEIPKFLKTIIDDNK